MANKQDTISIGFEEKIWKAADILRGSLDASQYKGVVLGGHLKKRVYSLLQ